MDTVTDTTPAIDHKAIVAEKSEALAAAKEAEKARKAELKEAQKNLKAAVAYNKSVADDAEEKTSAVETEQGWAAEVERLQAAVAEATEDCKTCAAEVKDAKAAAKEAGKTAKPKVERVVQNGQTQPRPGTISAKLWGIFDTAQERLGRAPAVAEIMEEARAAGVVDGSIKAGYAQWRKFHGVTGRVKSQAQIDAEAAKAAAPAAPAPELELEAAGE